MKRFIAIFMTLCLALGVSSVSAWADDTSAWKSEAKMPTALRDFGSCVVGDKIYLFGGSGSSTVEIYDTKNQTWKLGTPMPIGPSTCKAVAIGNKIYVMGTLGSTDSSTYMQVYDISTNTWTRTSQQSEVPSFNKGFGLVTIGEKIYIMNFNNNNNNPITSITIYDPITGKWTNGKSGDSKLRWDFMACAGGNNIYVIGGQSNNLLEVYDTTADTWKELGTLPACTYGATAVMVGNNLYLIGGNNPSAVHIYNAKTNSWSKGTPLKTPRSGLVSVAVDGKIYAIGGSGNLTGDLNTVESLQAGASTDSAKKLSVLLNTGENVQLSTSFDLDNNKNFTWSSTDEKVATVDSNGKVTAVAEGIADIYAQNADGTFKEYIPVKVVKGIADELRLSVHLKAGEKAKLYLTDDASRVTWTSMDESIATVAGDGQLTGVKKGLAIVKAELDGQAYQIYVRVNG